jgi:hypothetical protein
MEYRIGSMIIVQTKHGLVKQEVLVLVSFKNGSGFRGHVPVTDRLVTGLNSQIKEVVRY